MEKEKNKGNTRLPYGLCERYKVELPKDCTPTEAWQALEEATGITPEMVYNELDRRANYRPKIYPQNADYSDILADDLLDDVELPLIKEYLKELTSDKDYIARKEREERRLAFILFVEKALKGKLKPTDSFVVSKITDRQRADVERLTGESLNATKNLITAQTIIEHINKRHGANGKADRSMADIETYGEIADVLMNYDSAELLTKKGRLDLMVGFPNKHNKPSKQVVFSKKAKGSITYIVTEAITDSKQGEIRIMTMFTKKSIGR